MENNMLRSKTLRAVALAAAFAIPQAFAQQEGTYKSEVSVQALGSFLKETDNDGVRQSATNSGGVLANYRYFFNRNHGVELNYGYTQNTQSYGLLSAGPTSVRVRANEVTAAYVFRYPMHRITPFALAGVGGLVFTPFDGALGSTQARAAFTYGGGADFTVTDHIFLRAQYRGLIYNSPTFDLAGLNGLDRFTHQAVPSAGIGFRF
jgi:outer membrane immunogenic protein